VDEAHQITHDAFNAFLKTLEEPPDHAVFVMRRPNIKKIPATILSRCQLFRFKRVSSDDIAAHLEKILSSEKVKSNPKRSRLGQSVRRSVRDALSLSIRRSPMLGVAFRQAVKCFWLFTG